MTQQPTCGYILRAETGACEHLGPFKKPCGEPRGFSDNLWKHDMPLGHPYLGPSLGVCGHPRDVHREEVHVGTEHHVPAHCESCWDDDDQFIEGRFVYRDHPFQSAAEEPVDV